MPRGNGTGPMGRGAMTGWGRGACRGPASTDGYRGGAGGWGPGRGRGFGTGVGAGAAAGAGGRGWRNWFHATGVPGWLSGRWGAAVGDVGEGLPEDDRRILELRSAALESELQSIRQRLDELGDSASATE